MMVDMDYLLAAKDRLFDCPPDLDVPALAAEMAERLAAFEAEAEDDPTANPILRLAFETGERLASGALDWAVLEQLVQHLTVSGFHDRAARLGARLGETGAAANELRLSKLFQSLTLSASGTRVPFQSYRALVETAGFGIVITAHPTFSTSGALMHCLNRLATGGEVPAASLSGVHRPDDPLTLDAEHALSLEAIANIRAACHRAWKIAMDVARQAYPAEWKQLTPGLLTVASWVGYDLDGRSDISFADMLAKRLLTQARQLSLLHGEVEEILHGRGADAVSGTLRWIQDRLDTAAREIAAEAAVFSTFHAGESASREAVRALSKHLDETQGRTLVTAAELMPALDGAIAAADDATATRLMVLRAELAGNGIALARTHVRINSTQLHNAIRKQVGLDSAPDDPRFRQSYLAAITQLIGGIAPVTINFGSLIAERTSARRLFMTVAQMLKYMDGAIPVRFLIAECESAFTVLVALYYAKLFAIADRLEICPLFETEKALQVGSRIIEQLIDNPHYRAYLLQHRRLCIQTGYSDAGRFLGQPAAVGSIERLKERIIRLFERHRIEGVELVFFDTHGESVGRGGHPGGLRDRFDYIHAPHVQHLIEERRIAYKQEASFQGGDGYLPFMNEAGSLAVVTSALEWRLQRQAWRPDPFYEQRDYVTEFLTTTKEFQSGLIANPDYGVLLGTYGANLLYRTGSRASRRLDASETAARPQISQFRAIPHNAVLQQLGLLVNTVGGCGEAIAHDPGRFVALYATSQRFRAVMDMVRYAARVSNPRVLKAYVDTLDPGLWLLRAAAERDAARATAYRRIADTLEGWNVHAEQVRVFRRLLNDFSQLETGLERLPPLSPTGGRDTALNLLGALRLAIIHELYALGTEVPEFSTRNDSANRRVFLQILQLSVPEAAEALKRIFPAHEAETGEGDFGEPASYDSGDAQNYEVETLSIFDPLLKRYELMRRISTAVSYRIGFIG